MAMFFCAECQRLRDSDDGCEEAPASKYQPPHQLLCIDCVDEPEEARERAEAARIDRQHDLIRMMDDAAHRARRVVDERGIDEQRAWYDTSEELK